MRTDAERLDWLEANDASISRSLRARDAYDPFEVGNLLGYGRGRTLRMAIDAAIAIHREMEAARSVAAPDR